jgi:predicted ArsR family transcriptional regulator
MQLSIYPSHYKGEETRQKIINLLSKNNGLTTHQIAKAINKSVIQTKRQLQKIQVNKGVYSDQGKWFITQKAYELNLTSYWD